VNFYFTSRVCCCYHCWNKTCREQEPDTW